MFRCFLALLTLLITHASSAQGLSNPIPLKRTFTDVTLRAQLTFLNPPALTLNGQPALLSPGSKIRNQNNLVVLSGTLVGQQFKVHYTLDPITDQIRDIWLLRPEEEAITPWPQSLAEAAAWRFDSVTQRWSKP